MQIEKLGDKLVSVSKFFAERGFGFIRPDRGGDDVFVHIKNCEHGDPLVEGQRVQFVERPSRRQSGKFEAFSVVPL